MNTGIIRLRERLRAVPTVDEQGKASDRQILESEDNFLGPTDSGISNE